MILCPELEEVYQRIVEAPKALVRECHIISKRPAILRSLSSPPWYQADDRVDRLETGDCSSDTAGLVSGLCTCMSWNLGYGSSIMANLISMGNY